MPDRITIKDLEVRFHVGVPEEERATPQKLLITIEMTHDLGPSAANDNLAETINYFTVCQAVKALGQARRWKLIEALADDILRMRARSIQANRGSGRDQEIHYTGHPLDQCRDHPARKLTAAERK